MIRALLALSLFAAACGGTAEGYDGPAVAGKLTVGADDMAGADGKTVVFLVTSAVGGPLLGSVCTGVATGSTRVSATVKSLGGDNPCSGGDALTFEPGAYAVFARIYAPGSQLAERCTRATVNVDGDTDATLPAFGSCP